MKIAELEGDGAEAWLAHLVFYFDFNNRNYQVEGALEELFGSYWFETGTPTFLARCVGKSAMDIRKFTDRRLYSTEKALSDYRVDNPDLLPLLYQTGYLSMAGYDAARQRVILSFPNEDVKYGFLDSLLPVYAPEIYDKREFRCCKPQPAGVEGGGAKYCSIAKSACLKEISGWNSREGNSSRLFISIGERVMSCGNGRSAYLEKRTELTCPLTYPYDKMRVS